MKRIAGESRGKCGTKGRYVGVFLPDHPRALPNGYVPEHVLVAERALGRPLPSECPVHHFDENPRNNQNGNLIICQDRQYHMLLHVRARIGRAGGDPNFHAICSQCKALKPRAEFFQNRARLNGLQHRCRRCDGLGRKRRRMNEREKHK
jgi:hypothetical protein